MKILLDTANIDAIRQTMRFYPIAGFTTNPSILSKESSDVKETLMAMKELAGGKLMIHAQVTAPDTETIVEQAITLRELFGENFYAKIPVTQQGIKAVSLLKEQGVQTTVTAIFTPMQALMAGLAGAAYVAPYVDRLDNITSNGMNVVREIADLFTVHGLPTQILAASFKNVQQVYNVASLGAHAVTVSCELCQKLLFHPYTDKSLEDFEIDWKSKFGDAEITDLLR